MSDERTILWKHQANWLNGEHLYPVENRTAIQGWAQSYMQAMHNMNSIGKPHPDTSMLPVQYDESICLQGYGPRDENQLNAILLTINWGRAALFAKMGGGKTFMGGYAAMWWRKHSAAYHMAGDRRKVTLVVCPKNVLPEWEEQSYKFFGSRVSVFPDTIDWYNSDIVVTNYEQVGNILPYAHMIGGIILDESQKVKNHKTLAFGSVAALTVAAGVWHRMVLTGTPLKNKPDDLFSQLTYINPYAFNFSHSQMMKQYFAAIPVQGRRVPSYKFKTRWAFLFHDIVNNNAFSMEVEACPEGSETDVVVCGLTAEQENYMEVVRSGVLTVLRGAETFGGMRTSARVESIAIKNALIKSQQVSSGFFVAGDDTWRFSSDKMAKLYDTVVNEWGEHQVIVWVYFRETAERLAQAFSNAGVSNTVIMGGMSKTARDAALESFKRGHVRVIMSQLTSMNAGLNLQFCNHDVFAELDWSNTTIEQALARTERPGQKKRCYHRFFYTEGTADEMLVTAFQEKRKITAKTIRGYAEKNALDSVKVSKMNPIKRDEGGAVDKFFSNLNKS